MEFKNLIETYKEEFLSDLQSLIAIPSVRDLSTASKDAPFGKNIQAAMDCFQEIASRYGFQVEQDDGYAIHAQIGEGDDYIGALGHLDVVEARDQEEWISDPFTMEKRDGFLYGRGVNDDKGPLLACLYAVRIIHDQSIPLAHPIRIIAGGAEETTWECMDHYFKHHKQPLCGFSPDGNFPIVNGEKGICEVSLDFGQREIQELKIECRERFYWVCYDTKITFYHRTMEELAPYALSAVKINQEGDHVTLHYQGDKVMSRNPQRGKNALFLFFSDFKDFPFQEEGMKHIASFFQDCLVDDIYGVRSGFHSEDFNMGKTSLCVTSVTCNSTTQEICLDLRFVKSTSIDQIKHQLEILAKQYHFKYQIERYKRLLYVDEESDLIQSLKVAYQRVMNEEASLLTKGGASYARVLDCGVAFGATFEGEDPKPHMPNENICIASLWKALAIYMESFLELAVDKKDQSL